MVKIAKVLGTDELFAYLEKYDIELEAQYDEILARYISISLPIVKALSATASIQAFEKAVESLHHI